MLATFGSIQLYAPLANAVVNPFLPLVMALATLSGALGHLYAPLAIVPAAPLWLLLRGLLASDLSRCPPIPKALRA